MNVNFIIRLAMTIMRILLADDHTLFRQGLKLLLQHQPGYQVVAEAASLEEISALLQQHAVDLMILDYSIPGGDSSAVLGYCKQRYPELRILALTGIQSGIAFRKLSDAGADGILRKDISGPDLLHAIQQIMAGARIISSDVQQEIDACATQLTARELQIVQMINQGLSNSDMAEQLKLSAKTVDKHRENTMRKLQVSNVIQLINKARALLLL
jgi:DNA-binding NarL/FixJ family response regulator